MHFPSTTMLQSGLEQMRGALLIKSRGDGKQQTLAVEQLRKA